MISLIARHSRAVLKLWLSAIALQLFYFQYFRNNGGNSFCLEDTLKTSHQVESFQESWYRIHQARVHLDSILRPWFHNISFPPRVWFRFLTSGLRVSSVVSAFKQRLGMASWSTLAATRGACCFSVRPLCHLQCLITEMEHTSSCFLLWTQGSISWISLWTIAYVTDIENPRKTGL